MTSFGQGLSPARDLIHRILPRIYKFGVVLTANEQVARALVRGACRSITARNDLRGAERDQLIEAMRRTYVLWASKAAEDSEFQRVNPPQPKLFAMASGKSGPPSNAQLAKFLTGLPAQQRAALYLVYGDGVSYDEAAHIVGLEIYAFMKLLSRGHIALSHWLDQRGLADDFLGRPVERERRMTEVAA